MVNSQAWLSLSLLLLSARVCCYSARTSPILGSWVGNLNSTWTQDQYTTFFKTLRTVPTLAAFDTVMLNTIEDYNGSGVTPALAAAVKTQTKLLLTLLPDSDEIQNKTRSYNNDLQLLKNFDYQNNGALVDLLVGISIGFDDLVDGTQAGLIDSDAVAATYASIRAQLQNTDLSNVPIGHTERDVYWTTAAAQTVIKAIDFIMVGIYPRESNQTISSAAGEDYFSSTLAGVKSAAGSSKAVWVSTGWPADGTTTSLSGAQSYWDTVGCGELFNKTSVIWDMLIPNDPGSNPYNVLDGSFAPLFDLSCNSTNNANTGNSSSNGTSSGSSAASSSASATSAGGLSTGAKIGIGVGAGLGGLLLLGAAIFLARRYRSGLGKQYGSSGDRMVDGEPGLDAYAEPGVAVDDHFEGVVVEPKR